MAAYIATYEASYPATYGASGAAPPTPTWQAMDGETAKTLTIAGVQAEDFGRLFRCVVSGLANRTSNSATIVEE